MPCSYLVFARTPALGRVKTRLAATLGNENTLRLYEAMLEDTVQNVRQRLHSEDSPVHQAFIFAYPPETTPKLTLWLQERNLHDAHIHILPQEGKTLGEQMFRAFCIAAERNALPALIMGSDSPTLPQFFFAEAEQALIKNQATIGRADDGGFYIMGLPFADESFFFGDDYSNETVYERTITALRRVFPKVQELPDWIDIDDSASFKALLRLHSTHSESYQHYKTLSLAHKLRLDRSVVIVPNDTP